MRQRIEVWNQAHSPAQEALIEKHIRLWVKPTRLLPAEIKAPALWAEQYLADVALYAPSWAEMDKRPPEKMLMIQVERWLDENESTGALYSPAQRAARQRCFEAAAAALESRVADRLGADFVFRLQLGKRLAAQRLNSIFHAAPSLDGPCDNWENAAAKVVDDFLPQIKALQAGAVDPKAAARLYEAIAWAAADQTAEGRQWYRFIKQTLE
jgi:hypothetical protein